MGTSSNKLSIGTPKVKRLKVNKVKNVKKVKILLNTVTYHTSSNQEHLIL